MKQLCDPVLVTARNIERNVHAFHEKPDKDLLLVASAAWIPKEII